MIRLIFFLAMVSNLGHAQTTAGIARRVRSGSTLPSTCSDTAGDVFNKTGTDAGMYRCSALNTWTLWTGGGLPSGVSGDGAGGLWITGNLKSGRGPTVIGMILASEPTTVGTWPLCTDLTGTDVACGMAVWPESTGLYYKLTYSATKIPVGGSGGGSVKQMITTAGGAVGNAINAGDTKYSSVLGGAMYQQGLALENAYVRTPSIISGTITGVILLSTSSGGTLTATVRVNSTDTSGVTVMPSGTNAGSVVSNLSMSVPIVAGDFVSMSFACAGTTCYTPTVVLRIE